MVEQNTAPVAGASTHDEVLSRVGHMTRALHENLRGLGLDKLIEKAASDIPDARDRLDYVAQLSEQAAKKVLDSTDAAGPLQDAIEARSTDLKAGWQALLDAPAGEATDAQWRALAQRTIAGLDESRAGAVATRSELMSIMMAQDFQDLTGQVIGRITGIAQNLEKQLVQVLIDFAPSEIKRELDNGLMNGPQIKPMGTEVVANQGQVDDLLDSLGF
ncbi:MAG: protein phosphatase CheZ [Massilia sp.]|jgi:chemotaxis protein CheZ|uniref:protein phosphatase CheZ n=1 Tax=Massilia sp. TaxID=1882437 RepID=UPI001994D3DE|nr:protein phosphatase CheZ [Oxalobacteraceae sp. CFBP 8761]MBD8626635.1 protein phosphatase CheZ [Oxalobacteraceae sp. CFBP 8753]MBD8631128.1 protein phosphatase CheZ [Oxalobacteraceae sp. CFBP 8755]MBD8723289.1 protein phosphatase CheZ [Oxalobacteraceae sp. CFBP 13708]